MGTHNICLYKEVDKKYTGYNLKTTELLVCALIGVCAVIRLNMVILIFKKKNAVYLELYDPGYNDENFKLFITALSKL